MKQPCQITILQDLCDAASRTMSTGEQTMVCIPSEYSRLLSFVGSSIELEIKNNGNEIEVTFRRSGKG